MPKQLVWTWREGRDGTGRWFLLPPAARPAGEKPAKQRLWAFLAYEATATSTLIWLALALTVDAVAVLIALALA